MSREIRCRAWDKIEKKMWFPIIRPDGRLMAENQLGGYVTFDDPQDPLMQYTGLIDRNGEELCIGDIYTKWEGKEPEVAEDILSIGYQYGECGLIEGENGFEILGNIYENPELLEEKE